MARVALIVNPVATRLRRSTRTRVVRALAPEGLRWVLPTRARGDAARLARWAADQGAEVVVTLGGDGTAADVAHALAGRPVAMAPLPAGSTNVFGRAAGWPASLDRAIAAVGGLVAGGRTADLTLGRLVAGPHDRTFCVNAGVGIDAETVDWIERRPRLKRRLRQAGFAAGAVRAGLRRPDGPPGSARARRRPALRVRADGGAETRALSVIAACGSPYAWLGTRPLDLVPGAAFDGVLRWLAVVRLRPHELVTVVVRTLIGARVERHPALVRGHARRELVVRADVPVAVQADGEPLGRHAEVRLRPGPTLRLLAFHGPPSRDSRTRSM